METSEKMAKHKVDGRNRRRQANRTALLTAARSAFLTGGYRAVTIGQITRLAGVAHGTFYGHFANKEAALICLLDDLAEAFQATMEMPLPPMDVEENRAVILTMIGRFLRLAYEWRSLLAVYREAMSVAPLVREHWERVIGAVQRAAADDIKRLQALGVAKAVFDPDLTAEALVRLVEHFFWRVVLGSLGEEDIPAVATHCTRLYVEGVYA
ncbi:MAG: TetR/AcrR family transcriptional regulator [Bacillota bacterium]|jgi:AcrR family transcriptional regulator|nr:MAG: TetR/AcrR family transcriptional regulator [Bacillota bacterium]